MRDAVNPTAERREQILGELAEWMHAAAREAQRRLLEAETTEAFVQLTGSLAKLARGVRQSILAHRKLESERLDVERRAELAAGSDFVPRHIKRVRLRTAITRHVWNEFDDDEDAELFHDDLNARLDELEGTADFLVIPIDDLIARLCRDLGFEPPQPRPASATSPVATAPGRGQSPPMEGASEGTSLSHGGAKVHAPNTS